MILVLLGTFPTEFKRPLLELERLYQSNALKEEIIVQSGHTLMESSHMLIRPFIPPDELIQLYNDARIIITHAGTGSLIKGIKLKKKIIAIARLSKYGEMVDDHQVEILDEFTKLNYILPWREDMSLLDILSQVEEFSPAPYRSNKQAMINYLKEYIDSL